MLNGLSVNACCISNRNTYSHGEEMNLVEQLKEENEQLTQLLIQEQEEVLKYKPIYLKLLSEIVTLEEENKRLKEILYEIQNK